MRTQTTEHIKSWAEENEVEFKAFTDWHLSLSDKGKRLDIWTGKKRLTFRNVKTEKFGMIKGDLIDFLNGWLNGEAEPTKNELLATYINNRFGITLTPENAAEIAKYIKNQY